MTKLEKAFIDGVIYYANGSLEKLLKIMDEVADIRSDYSKDEEFQWFDYKLLTDEQNEKYENGTLWRPMNPKIRVMPMIPKDVRNRKYVLFSFTNGKVRFGCYNGEAK